MNQIRTVDIAKVRCRSEEPRRIEQINAEKIRCSCASFQRQTLGLSLESVKRIGDRPNLLVNSSDRLGDIDLRLTVQRVGDVVELDREHVGDRSIRTDLVFRHKTSLTGHGAHCACAPMATTEAATSVVGDIVRDGTDETPGRHRSPVEKSCATGAAAPSRRPHPKPSTESGSDQR